MLCSLGGRREDDLQIAKDSLKTNLRRSKITIIVNLFNLGAK